MERVEAPTLVGNFAPSQGWQASDGDQTNFAQLASDASWRTTWATIVCGKFTSSPYSCLPFFEDSTAYAELYQTDGQGRLIAPYLSRFNPLGDRTTWTLIVPGNFGPSGFTGLLLYDRVAGFGRFYDSDGQGNLLLRSEYSGWRTSWTHIVAGRFVASSCYSAVFFYDAAEGYAEIWAIDGTGLVGHTPFATFSIPSTLALGGGVPTSTSGAAIISTVPPIYTRLVAGDFHWTPGFIDSVPTLTDLFFYDAVSGRGDMYRCVDQPDPSVLLLAASSDSLPTNAASVVAGNFGGAGNTDLAFYNEASGTLRIYSFVDVDDTSANLVLRDTPSGLRPSADLMVPGNYWMSDPDDHWFNDGPPVSSPPPYDPNWRFGTGAFFRISSSMVGLLV